MAKKQYYTESQEDSRDALRSTTASGLYQLGNYLDDENLKGLSREELKARGLSDEKIDEILKSTSTKSSKSIYDFKPEDLKSSAQVNKSTIPTTEEQFGFDLNQAPKQEEQLDIFNQPKPEERPYTSYTKEDDDALKKGRQQKKKISPILEKNKNINKSFAEDFIKGEKTPESEFIPKTTFEQMSLDLKDPTKLDSVMRKFNDFTDEQLGKLGDLGQKILKNRYARLGITKGLPLVSGFLDVKDLKKHLSEGEYGEALGSGLGAASAGAALLSAPVASGVLGAGALGVQGGLAQGRHAEQSAQMNLDPEYGFPIPEFKKKTKDKELAYNRDLFRKNKLSELQDQELIDSGLKGKFRDSDTGAIKLDIPKNFKAPNQANVFDFTKDLNQKLNLNRVGLTPDLLFGQMQQESNFEIGAIGKNKDGSVPKDAARGLMQVKPAAYTEALKQQELLIKQGKLDAPILDPNKNYEDVMNNPQNWKDQVAAGMLYHSWIADNYNKDGSPDQQFAMFLKGPKYNLESAREQYLAEKDKNSNIEDPDSYINNIKKFSEKFKQLDEFRSLSDQYRTTELDKNLLKFATELPSTDKLDTRQNLINFLRASTPEEKQAAKDKLLPPQLVLQTSPLEEQRRNEDDKRLEKLYAQYQGLRANEAPISEPKEQVPAIQAPIESPSETEKTEQTADSEQNISNQISDAIDLEKGYTEGTLENLKKVQEKANKLRLLNLAVQGTQQIGSGLSGAISGFEVTPSKEFKAMSDLADIEESQFKERVSLQENDPTSQESAAARNMAKSVLVSMGVDPNKIEGMSAKGVFKILPQIKGMYDSYMDNIYRTEKRVSDKETKQSLINQRTFANLPTRIESLGGPAGTNLRRRLQQVGNIYGTLGINPSELEKMSEEDLESKLDDAKKLQAVEAAIEVNSLLSGSGTPAASTLQKLLQDSLYQRGMTVFEFLANAQYPRGQGAFLKDIIKLTARVEKTADQRLRDMETRTLAGYKRFADDPTVGEDFVNFINKRGISLEDLDAAKPISKKPEESKEDPKIRQYADKNFKGNYEIAKKYLIQTGQLNERI